MSKQGKSRKSLLVGVIAAIVVLAALVVVLLTQCTGGQTAGGPTTQATEPSYAIENADLYWNLDRALYDGKSEAGMSSRSIGSDGYYHIRFFKDGQIVELKAADKVMVNNIEVRDLMGLVFDEDGVITDVIPIEQMPVEKIGWKFYVQSVGGNVVKVNSSDKFNGLEVVLKVENGAKVYDMTGTAGEPGVEAQAAINDRVMCVGDTEGNLKAIYIYDRSNMEISFQGECEHCEATVKWVIWKNTKKLPTEAGHFQLGEDVQLTAQQSMKADAKICLDLNGHRVDGANGKRIYSIHNLNGELAIMDTSEEKNGTLAAHGTSEAQGLCVWVRYGAFYLYDGILDASDAVTTNVGGTSVYVASGRFFYMNGGELIGGTAMYKWNESSKKYTNGQGATLFIKGGKAVINDGVIRDGYAKSVAVTTNGKTSYQRGLGGNIYVSSGTLEINGGIIKNGRAGAAGNIFVDGTAEFTMTGGTISGGVSTDPGRNCGNLYINTKVKATILGGRIEYGSTKNAGGNVVVVGKLSMSGGGITGGRLIDATTGKVKQNANSANVYVANGGTFTMYGGKIDGSVGAIDSNATDGKRTVVGLAKHAWINGEHMDLPGLTLMTGKYPVKLIVDPLRPTASIGVHASGVFSEETLETNLVNFYSDVDGVDVVYQDGRLAMGKMACLCGAADGKHFGDCDGTELLWGPWTSTTSLPTTAGNYILMNDVKLTSQQTIGKKDAGDVINLNLNGKTVSSNQRVALVYADLSITDHAGGGVISGMGPTNNKNHSGLFQVAGGSLDLYSGTLKLADDHYILTNAGVVSVAAGAELNMFGGTIDGRNAGTAEITEGGAVRLSGTMNVYSGEIFGTKAVNNGGAISVWKGGQLTVKGGTVTGAETGAGGTIYVKEGGKAVIAGGTVTGGTADGEIGTDKEKGKGGNIMVAAKGALEVTGGKIVNGTASANGGNIAAVENSTVTIRGGFISNGMERNKTTNGSANVYIRNNGLTLSGGEIEGYISVIISSASYKNSVVKLSGAPVVKSGNTNLRLYAGSLANQPKVEIVGKLTGEAGSIGITMQNKPGVFATGAAAADGNVFFSDASGYMVSVNEADKTLSLETPRCMCGAAKGAADTNSVTHEAWCTETMLVWKAWNGTGTLTTGNYYLSSDLSGVAAQTVSGAEINLDLAGHKLTATDTALNVGENAAVYIVDSENGKGELAGAVVITAGEAAVYDANVTGTVQLTGGSLTVGGSTKLSQVTLAEGMKLTLNGLESDAAIAVSMTVPGVFAENVESDISALFESKDVAYEVTYTEADETLALLEKTEHSHCWCEGAENAPEHTCLDEQVWEPIEGKTGANTTLADGGFYYFNLTKSAQRVTVADNATAYLCLNGAHVRAQNVITLGEGSKLIICDCAGGGTLTTTKFSPVILKAGQEVTLMSGILSGTYSNDASRVSVLVEGGTFNMYGGSVERGCNKATTITATDKIDTEIGGNIHMTSGAVNLYGGSVIGGKLQGADRDVTVAGGSLTVGKKAEIGILYLEENQTITVDEKDLETQIGISMAKPGDPIAAVKTDVSAGFTSLVEGYPVLGLMNGNLVMSPELTVDGHYHCFCENAETLPADHKCSTLQQWTAVEKKTSSNTTLEDGGHYFLNWTASSAQSVTVADGATAYLCLNGATIYAKQAVTVGKGSTLHICDCSEGETGVITVSGSATNAPIALGTGVKTVFFYSGTITGSANGKKLTTVALSGGTPTFHMYGGTISGGYSTGNGGNVAITGANGKFYLHGGTITGGEVASGKHGGNVFLSKGQFVMNGGKITGGSCTGKGGNVMLLPNEVTASFTMNGGVIENGSAANGGNIAVNATGTGGAAIFTMNGGTVKGGTATTAGGNLFLYSDKDTVLVNAGSIIGGTVANAGGGNVTVAEGATVDGLN